MFCLLARKNIQLLQRINVKLKLTLSLKPQNNGPLYINTVIGTLAVDGWAVTFGTTKRGLGGLQPRLVYSSLYQLCYRPPINGECSKCYSMWHYKCLWSLKG